MEDEHMDGHDRLQGRAEAMEQQMQQLVHHSRTVEQRLRWWRGLACAAVMLSLLSLALPSGKAADTQPRGMAERMAMLEHTLSAMAFDDAANEVVITGANLRIVNGLGQTETTNGLGNLIVGYNESRSPNFPDTRTGSHNVVVGKENNFASFGGIVVGQFSEISGQFASVSGGSGGTASGRFAAVSGGLDNTASGDFSSVSGGDANRASGFAASISGGGANRATDFGTSISGGNNNEASASGASVCGGRFNIASGFGASISGGSLIRQVAPFQPSVGGTATRPVGSTPP